MQPEGGCWRARGVYQVTKQDEPRCLSWSAAASPVPTFVSAEVARIPTSKPSTATSFVIGIIRFRRSAGGRLANPGIASARTIQDQEANIQSLSRRRRHFDASGLAARRRETEHLASAARAHWTEGRRPHRHPSIMGTADECAAGSETAGMTDQTSVVNGRKYMKKSPNPSLGPLHSFLR